jgi:hypothetical protein
MTQFKRMSTCPGYDETYGMAEIQISEAEKDLRRRIVVGEEKERQTVCECSGSSIDVRTCLSNRLRINLLITGMELLGREKTSLPHKEVTEVCGTSALVRLDNCFGNKK